MGVRGAHSVLISALENHRMKRFIQLSLAQKVRLSKKKLKKYRESLKKKVKTFTGAYIEKKEYKRYRKYINSQAWREKRELALDFYDNNCGLCGSKFNLHVHHKTYKNLYRESMADLMLLCETCHKTAHSHK